VVAIRAALNIAVIACATIVGSIAALISRVFDATGDTVLRLARLWARLVTRLAGVKVALDLRARLDPKRPYVFMSNHASTLDIFALYATLPVRVRMIAKKQLAAIPLLGWAMWAGRLIFIDRHNAVAARRSIERAEERIRGGQSVLIFPEGTRTRDGTLLPFKKGGFHLAIDAEVPIVPVALVGTRALMPRGSWLLRPGEIRVIIGPPINTSGLSPEDRDGLLDRVRGIIAGMLDEPAVSTRRAPG
jgi:1-acyl-sn-glycerol-3-phosphate acyltransferase